MIMRLRVSQEVKPQGTNDIALTSTLKTWTRLEWTGEILPESRSLPELLA